MKCKIVYTTIVIILASAGITNSQSAGSTINPDSLNATFLEALIKLKIDSVRLIYKKKALIENDTLKNAATDQVNYIKEKKVLTHFQAGNSSKYSVSNRVEYYGLKNKYVGENIAYTYILTKIRDKKSGIYTNSTYQELADDIVGLWVKSKGHLKNIISDNFTETAVAVSYDKKYKLVYAGQTFSSD